MPLQDANPTPSFGGFGLKWLSLRGVMCNEADTVYDFVGCTIMNGSSKIEKMPLSFRLEATDPRPLLVPISELPSESKAN